MLHYCRGASVCRCGRFRCSLVHKVSSKNDTVGMREEIADIRGPKVYFDCTALEFLGNTIVDILVLKCQMKEMVTHDCLLSPCH